MRENTTLINGSSQKCLDQFKAQFADTTKISKVTCFFEKENFLLLNYSFDIPDVNMVVEYKDKSLVYITSLNCGYGEKGPGCTQELLIFIGVDPIIAEKLSYEKGFCIEKSEGHWIKHSVKLLFEQFSNDKKLGICKLDNSFTNVDITAKQITMIQPQQYDLSGLINCIKSMELTEIEFNLGTKEPIYSDIIPEYFSEKFEKKYDSRKFNGINLVLHGNLFSVFCFVSCDEILTLVNVLHTYIMKKPLFIGGVYGDLFIMSRNEKGKIGINLLKNLIWSNKRAPKIIYRIQVGEQNGY